MATRQPRSIGRLQAVALLSLLFALSNSALVAQEKAKPIPEKLVVLTFDDSAKSHYTIVRPILLKYKFGATFFITEGFDFATTSATT